MNPVSVVKGKKILKLYFLLVEKNYDYNNKTRGTLFFLMLTTTILGLERSGFGRISCLLIQTHNVQYTFYL